MVCPPVGGGAYHFARTGKMVRPLLGASALWPARAKLEDPLLGASTLGPVRARGFPGTCAGRLVPTRGSDYTTYDIPRCAFMRSTCAVKVAPGLLRQPEI